MKFGAVAAGDAAGAVLAHALRVGGRRLAKGRVLSAADARAIAAARREVVVARLEKDDIGENQAAAQIGGALAGRGLRAGAPVGGRVCLFAAAGGVLRARAAARINRRGTAAALATAADFSPLAEGEIAAALKIIPFAMPAAEAADLARLAAGALVLHPYRGRRAALIQTTLPFVRDAILDKTRRVTAARLARFGAVLESESRCRHRPADLAEALSRARAQIGGGIILIVAASAACDLRDVAPAAIAAAGGEIIRLGMPVDPGNLSALGKLGGADVLLMPGSARSPRASGADWILARLAAGIKVSAAQIAAMGVGGLLADIPERPAPRAGLARPRVFAALLAAGASRRMGRANKLLAAYRGMPLVRRAAQTLADARARGLLAGVAVVTGHAAAGVRAALAGIDAAFIHNPDYRAGMASSIQAALADARLAAADGLLIALGDMPCVTVADIAAVVGAFRPAAGADIAAPVHHGKRGNPALIGRVHFGALRALAGDVGARAFFTAQAAHIAEAEAGAGVLFDVDRRDDLE